MNKKLYVGGLPYSVTDDQLNELFAAHGTVESAKVITDRYTGRCRGFGFITFKNDKDAMTAIEEADGGELDGRTIKVREAKEKKTGDKRTGGGNRQGKGHSS